MILADSKSKNPHLDINFFNFDLLTQLFYAKHLQFLGHFGSMKE